MEAESSYNSMNYYHQLIAEMTRLTGKNENLHEFFTMEEIAFEKRILILEGWIKSILSCRPKN